MNEMTKAESESDAVDVCIQFARATSWSWKEYIATLDGLLENVPTEEEVFANW